MESCRRLQEGERFRFIDAPEMGVYVVDRVTPCAAVVKPLARIKRVVETFKDGVKEFSVPGRKITISNHAMVEHLG